MENFIGTLSGKLGGLDLAGLKIESEDNFSVTADGEKVISIENLQNGTLTSDDLDAITINGANVSVDDLEEATLTIQDGELKTSAEVDSGTIVEEILNLEDAIIVSGKENLTLLGGDAVIVEDTNAKVSITASKGKDTIYTSGSNVDIDLKAGGAAFLTENENIADAIAENSIAYDDGKLTVNSARATLQSISSGDDAAANYFVATERNASLTVGEDAEIWLDGSHGKTSLAGNDLDNTILAGNGDSSLWGGSLGDDLLVGGSGKNTFFYLQGNGFDTIAGAHDGDEVILSIVTLDQISGTSITADAVSINFTDGGSLQINSNANVTYQLADGSKYAANHAQAAWIAK